MPLFVLNAPSPDAPLRSDAAPATSDHAQSAAATSATADDEAMPSDGDSSDDADIQRDKAIIANGEDGINPEHEADTVIVQFAEGADANALNQALADKACVVDGAVTAEDIQKGYKAFDVAEGYDVRSAIRSLERVEGISDSQPNFIYRLDDDDLGAAGAEGLGDTQAAGGSELSSEWTINDPSSYERTWHLTQIDAYNAWDYARGDKLESGQKPVTVAVLDTGYDRDHPDLTSGTAGNYSSGNVIYAYDATAVVNSTATGLEIGQSHGTHTAGLVAAIANNGKGAAGVSHNAKVLPIQVFYYSSDAGGYVSDSLCMKAGYDFINTYQSTYNIRVASMSLGSYCTPSMIDDYDRLLITAETTAYNNGVLTVCSAGNGAESYGGSYGHFPGDYLPHCMNVIALDENGRRASYSNYNSSVTNLIKDISAPGGSYQQGVYSTVIGGYGYMSGTSMATPIVAGVAALLFTANPSLTPGNVIEVLHNTADSSVGPSGPDVFTGYGEVDACAAVSYVTQNNCFITGNSSMLVNGSATLKVVHPDTMTGSWTWSSENPSIASVDNNGHVTGVAKGKTQIKAVYGTGAEAITLTRDVGVYEVSFLVRNKTGETAATKATILAGDSVEVKPVIDPSGGKWTIESSDNSILSLDLTNDNYMRIWGMNKGTAYFTVTSSDNPDLTASFEIEVQERPISDANIELSSSSFTYNGYARKPSVELSFHKMDYTDGEVSYIQLEEGIDYTLQYSNNINAGTATITINGKGCFTGSTSATFRINKASISNAKITVSPTSFVFDGKWKSPSTITVKDIGQNANSTITGQCSIVKGSARLGTGTVTIKANSNCANFTGSTTRSFTVSVAKKPMYRLYNKWSGEHFYTADTNEYNKLGSIGWKKEGVAWEAPVSSNTPVYRLYNRWSGDHHYTTSKSEYDSLGRTGWNQEGIGFYSDDNKTHAVYRGFNRYVKIGTHHYTTNSSEMSNMVRNGWIAEGIGWYAL